MSYLTGRQVVVSVGKNQELAFWVSRVQHDSLSWDVVKPGRNSLLPRHSSKPSLMLITIQQAPRWAHLQRRRLISACAGNSSKLSFQQFVKMYMKHKAKDIDWLDPGRENKQTVLIGCCHLILFRGLSDRGWTESIWRFQRWESEWGYLFKTPAILWIKLWHFRNESKRERD